MAATRRANQASTMASPRAFHSGMAVDARTLPEPHCPALFVSEKIRRFFSVKIKIDCPHGAPWRNRTPFSDLTGPRPNRWTSTERALKFFLPPYTKSLDSLRFFNALGGQYSVRNGWSVNGFSAPAALYWMHVRCTHHP